ncbi:MAG: undecaprenyldiphospho-muramoylpentapeptide beta-N-acetylglucosaminyltransferase [Zoogloeaceae bacterium]|nr:undecaprenyldiphospho-muramoylpentapeptide beta-N-acetylglucosaminyltransferase [Zoogloeaceae bacterium]
MAGGTGGHIFPALAVADVLRAEGWRVLWLGNPDSMESRLVPRHGYEIAHLRFAALRGKGMARKFLLPFNLLRGLWRAWSILRQAQPAVVLGMGGYVTFPGGVMAALLRIPLVIHEQNSIPGLANRVLATVARRVLTGFPDAFGNGVWTGNPVRDAIARVPPLYEREIAPDTPLNMLVIGGSLGARALNEIVPRGLALLPPGTRPRVVHQSGEEHLEALRTTYAETGVEAHCAAFIEDMPGAYAWADIVVCRAGALTIAELAAAGVPAILVPFPSAVDDHQTANARFLASAGGAFLLPQSELTPEAVARIGNYRRGQLLEMARKTHALARPRAAREVADACKEVAR